MDLASVTHEVDVCWAHASFYGLLCVTRKPQITTEMPNGIVRHRFELVVLVTPLVFNPSETSQAGLVDKECRNTVALMQRSIVVLSDRLNYHVDLYAVGNSKNCTAIGAQQVALL